jgi:hypothetical protein
MEVNMITKAKLLGLLVPVALTGLIYGCGSSGSGGGGILAAVDTSSVRNGSVVQGPVVGATVFADNVKAGSGTRFVKDVGEMVATIDPVTGKYTLPSMPSYNFILVSTGGTDTITTQRALLLLAPAGCTNITPLTTLVALDTTKKIEKKLEALNGGRKYDSNVSTNATPAILLLIKSAETAVKSVSDTIVAAQPTISDDSRDYIQAQIWQQIAKEFAATAQDLSTPSGVNAALTVAMTGAITDILAKNSDFITAFNTTSAKTISDNAVGAAATSLGTTLASTVPLDRNMILLETALLAPTVTFPVAVQTTVTDISISLASIKPPTTRPPRPPITVITNTTEAVIIQITASTGGDVSGVTGATGGTGGSGSGIGVTF